MKLVLIAAAILLAVIATTGNYACGLFRFGPPVESVGWRYLSNVLGLLAYLGLLLAYLAGRIGGDQ